MFTTDELKYYQWRKREFFALIPRLTITGWAWLVDLVEVETVHDPFGKERRRSHFERLYHA